MIYTIFYDIIIVNTGEKIQNLEDPRLGEDDIDDYMDDLFFCSLRAVSDDVNITEYSFDQCKIEESESFFEIFRSNYIGKEYQLRNGIIFRYTDIWFEQNGDDIKIRDL